jgi:hypothetical protein
MAHEAFIIRYQYNSATDKLGEGGFGSVFKAYGIRRQQQQGIQRRSKLLTKNK